MYCQNRISYRVQEGDSLYKLAKQFHTTVTELIPVSYTHLDVYKRQLMKYPNELSQLADRMASDSWQG